MQVLPNRKVRARDTVRGALNLRAEPRDAVSQRCRHCGFMAFRARERCPVCGESGWPFDPLRERTDDAHAAHAGRPVPTWSSRVAAAVRSAAFKRPRASSAPLLSILTVVLMVGGYVTFDQMCKADPVCRGPAAPVPTTVDASVQAPDVPTLPVVAAPVSPVSPVYAAHPDDDAQVAATPSHRSDAGRHAPTMLAHNAPAARPPGGAHAGGTRAGGARAAGIRVAEWKGGTNPVRRTHPIRRVSAHTRHGRRAAASETQMAMLYHGH
ncbi:ATP-dependent serine protease [Burkholderia sp. IMCC1007]|uniref:ATP-dependent serine protease n=1 Tax=Burkholderia sp. IMCC1007 TaxID=3004104 RepID=UPI0022B5665B|nr:ATP-dependent serine protease [Burkholderia sp. IMCC1007]